MREGAINMIAEKGATGTAFDPIGRKHEMIDDQLAAALEKIGQGFLAFRSIEDVILLYLDPGKFAALRAHRVSLVRQFLFLNQELLTGLKPLHFRDYFGMIH